MVEAVAATLVAAGMLGTLGAIIKHMDKKAGEHKVVKEHKYRTSQMKDFLHGKAFPPDLQTRILAQDHHDFIRHLGLNEEDLFKDCPKILRQDIANELYLDLVCSLPLFKACDPAFLYSVTRAVKPLTLMAGWYVFRKDDEANEMYFIRDGTVEVCSADGTQVFVTLRSGGFFGEIALLENCKRTASVRAAVDTDLCFLSRTDFEEILDSYPHARKTIEATVEERKAADRKRAEEAEKAKKLAAEKEAAKAREKELKEMRSRRGRKKWGVGRQSQLSMGLSSFGMSSGHGNSSRMSFGSRMSGLASTGSRASSGTGKGFFSKFKMGSTQQISQDKLSSLLQNSTSSVLHMEATKPDAVAPEPGFNILGANETVLALPDGPSPELLITPPSPPRQHQSLQDISEDSSETASDAKLIPPSNRKRSLARHRSARGADLEAHVESGSEEGESETESETEMAPSASGVYSTLYKSATGSGSMDSVSSANQPAHLRRALQPKRRGSWDAGIPSPSPSAVPQPPSRHRRRGSLDATPTGSGNNSGSSLSISPSSLAATKSRSRSGPSLKQDDIDRRIQEWERKHREEIDESGSEGSIKKSQK
ncbi:Cyclic nucleotide-gated olfactory channel [Rhizophlyctis rosea]|nr:Cyclic nucleotide-gated olfactory channel [Rhizophlyctis rosea]